MKFYIDKKLFACWVKIIKYKLTSIYIDNAGVIFLKNGIVHNAKNAAYISKNNRCRKFYLNNKLYGYEDNFTKKSWRKFVKLQVFI